MLVHAMLAHAMLVRAGVQLGVRNMISGALLRVTLTRIKLFEEKD
jgi:hypothetical protein